MNNIQIKQWYARAQINYAVQYMALYAAFNAWYQEYTNSNNDREAINRLQADMLLWDSYQHGTVRYRIHRVMILLVECTQREPIPHVTRHWRGTINHKTDWSGLLEYWYRVRCLVMHGAQIREPYIYLAYESLNIFMGEMVARQNINTVYNTSKRRYN